MRVHVETGAPALLGFDEEIEGFCRWQGGSGTHAETSVKANQNILSLFDGSYNTCTNLEWQICAARGRLPGQGGRDIRFAYAPGRLEPTGGGRPIGSCTGYHPAGCWDDGYASSDIFYLEACMFSMMCKNREEFFRLNVGDTWQCELDEGGYARMRDLLVRGPNF